MTETRIRVVIVEDHPGVRAGIRKLLEAAGDIDVIGEAEDGAQAIEIAGSRTPDLMLMDVELPVMRGDLVMLKIREQLPDVKVIAVSSYKDRSYIRSMLDNGASGYITKEEAPEMLLEAIHAVHTRGDSSWISPEAYKHSGATFEEPLLPAREMRLLEHILAERSEAHIARALAMDAGQVRKYMQLLMRKFDTNSVAGLRETARRILRRRSAAEDGTEEAGGDSPQESA